MTCTLLLHHGLGDVILALPALARAAEQNKNIQFDVIVKSNLEQSLLQLTSLPIRSIRALNGDGRDTPKLRPFGLPRLLREYGNRYFLPMHASSTLKLAMLAKLSGCPVTIGPNGRFDRLFSAVVKMSDYSHKSYYYDAFFVRAGLSGGKSLMLGPNVCRHLFNISDTEVLRNQACDSISRPFILLFPGSGEKESHKRWPIGNWATFIKLFLARFSSHKVILCGATNELYLLDEVHRSVSEDSRVSKIAGLDLATLLDLISKAQLCVSACCGASHLCSITGKPLIGIYGPTNPDWTGPFFQNLLTARTELECAPCYRKGYETGCGRPLCMQSIAPKLIFELAAGKLTSRSRSSGSI
jgi:ADP-heptose:LPS heptosyltransferase